MKKELAAAVLLGTLLPAALCWVSSREEEKSARPAAAMALRPALTASISAATEQTLPPEETVEVRVLHDDGTEHSMELGDYLTAVVLAEMPARFEPEALKAQAIVARTYTCRRMGSGKHGPGVLCTDPGCCQGFRSENDYVNLGGGAEAVEKIRQAVEQTRGQVLTYGGELIDATYFSCSGGFTEDAVAVWGQDVPYLQAVESPGEEMAPRFQEERRFSAEEFREAVGISGKGPVSEWIGPIYRTAGGGVDTAEICGETFNGTELRQLLDLRSTAFTVRAEDDSLKIGRAHV